MEEQSLVGFDPTIRSFYERTPEETRLQSGLSQMEALRTRNLIEKHAPAAPALVLDVGGAAGAYAGWLAEAGYTVHLVDATPRLVAEARRYSSTLAIPIASCEVGDARALSFASGCADFMLLLGPLYHLTTEEERLRALLEAKRVLKPGGLLFAAAISRWASALDALAHDYYADAVMRDIVERGVREGQHRNPSPEVNYFTTAYFHRPDDLRAELKQAGFAVHNIYGLEGPAGLLADFDQRWADPRRRADLIRVAEAIEAEPALLGLSAHLLAIARKPHSKADQPAAP